MKKIIRLSESQLANIIKKITKKVLQEQDTQQSTNDKINAAAQANIARANQASSQAAPTGNVAQKIAIYGGDGKIKGYVDYEPEKTFSVNAQFDTGRYSLDSLEENGQFPNFIKGIKDALHYVMVVNGQKGGVANQGKFAPVITVIGGESTSPNYSSEPGDNKSEKLPEGELAKRRAMVTRNYLIRLIMRDGPIGKNHYPFKSGSELNNAIKIGQPHRGPSKQDQFVKIKIAMNPLTDVVSNAPLSSQNPQPQPQQAPNR